MKAKSIMIQGTASSVGKSLITAGLCRLFKEDGFKVAPFKSQNMALNSFITKEGKEMGRAQAMQAEAAGIEPDVLMNPILLKPTNDQKSQVIIRGKVYKNLSAKEYYELKPYLSQLVKEVYEELAVQNEIIVIEGAGSPAEINLRGKDIVNMGMAEIADAPVILVGDIDKGGVFASLVGTMVLFNEEERKRVKGVIINKFRGDAEILKPGLKMLEEIINVPVLGVLPYTKFNLDDEDSLAERFEVKNEKSAAQIKVAVLKLPYISNFTDFNALENIEGVSLSYVENALNLGSPDLIIIPGSKNTLSDLQYLRKSGLEEAVIRKWREGAIIFGVCGGYQMLGQELYDPWQTESGLLKSEGMGLLPTRTVFRKDKVTTQVEAIICDEEGLLSGLGGTKIEGYEIHMGETELLEGCVPYLEIEKVLGQDAQKTDGVRNQEATVFGTYIHGIFDNLDFTVGLINNIRKKKGLAVNPMPYTNFAQFKESEYQKLAKMLRENLDLKAIYAILNGK